MDAQALIIWLVVGGVAGWLAGMVVKGGGYGLIGDIIVGIIGGLIAGWLLPQLGIAIGGGIIAAIINAFIGAVILLLARLGPRPRYSPVDATEIRLAHRAQNPRINRVRYWRPHIAAGLVFILGYLLGWLRPSASALATLVAPAT